MTMRLSSLPRTYSPYGPGSTLEFYDPSTLTPKDIFSDPELTTPISQPIAANAAGFFPTIYLQPSTYRVIHKNSLGVPVFDEDLFDPGLAAGFGLSSVVGVEQGGTGANNAAAARANLGAASSAAPAARASRSASRVARSLSDFALSFMAGRLLVTIARGG